MVFGSLDLRNSAISLSSSRSLYSRSNYGDYEAMHYGRTDCIIWYLCIAFMSFSLLKFFVLLLGNVIWKYNLRSCIMHFSFFICLWFWLYKRLLLSGSEWFATCHLTSIPAFENWLEMDLHCDVHHMFNTSWTKNTSSFSSADNY